MKKENKKQSFGKMRTREMIGYGFTDMAGNLLFVTFSSFIMIFYTDVLKLNPNGGWSAAIVLLVARIVNALLSVVWGSVIDHTKTKWGQCRPWFLWLAGPFIVTTFLCFCDFGGTPMAKFWYAMLLYIFASGFCYTGLAAAMSAVLPNLTNKNEERIKANSWRMVGGSLGSFITTVFTPLIIAGLTSGAFAGMGDAEQKKYSYMIVIGIWAVLAGVMLVSAFLFMREREYNPKAKSLSFKQSCHALRGNWPWYILVCAFIILWVAQSTRNGTAIYYAKWVLGNEGYSSFINGIQVLGFATAIATPFMVKAFGKKLKAPKTGVLMFGLLIAILGQLGMGLFDPSIAKFVALKSTAHYALFSTWWAIGVLGAQLTMGMFFMMIADTVDYGEYKTGVRAPGLLASVGSSFSIQLGGAFGQYVPMEIMGHYGYNPDLPAQEEPALNAIKFVFIWLPIIIYVVCAAIMIFYIRFEKGEEKIRQALAHKARNPKIVNLAKK